MTWLFHNEKNLTEDDIEPFKRLEKIKDSEIDYSDIPEADVDFWENATFISHEEKKL